MLMYMDVKIAKRVAKRLKSTLSPRAKIVAIQSLYCEKNNHKDNDNIILNHGLTYESLISNRP